MHSYTSLPEGSVRLLRLLPNSDENSRIECQLITFSMLGSGVTHPYDALSYVWGSEHNKQPIYVDGNVRGVTANLHVALSHLRHWFLERILWVDAICINQGDTDEKNQQVQSMAKIYAKANRVIVWLGDAADNGDQALEAIRMAAQEQHTNSAIYEPNHQATLAQTNSSNNEANKQAILRLLQRPWFQRIWVLQEVAAARHVLIKCGSTEIDGYAFCSGIGALKPCQSFPELNSLIRSVAYLITGAGFRPRHENRPAGRFSLDIRPLGELVDMYHGRKATDRRDKVYALLGMSSDDSDPAELSANYETSWKDVFQKLIRFCLPDQVSVSTWNEVEVAVVEAKGCVLGEVTSATEDATRNDRQLLEITWKRAPRHSDGKGKQPSRFTFQASAKTIKKGDVVCLLEGASTPTIVRLCDGFSTIIMITFPRTNDLPEWVASIARFPTDFLLVWDWDEFPKSQGGKDYGDFISSRGVPKCSKAGCECQNYLDKAARWWNFGVLLNGLERYEKAVKHFRKAMEVYGIGAALRSVGNTYPKHGRWKEEDEKALGIMEEFVLMQRRYRGGYKEHGHTPLRWAAEKGCEAFTRLLIENGADIEAKDRDGRTPLHLAAENGHEGVARLLVEAGADKKAKDRDGRTPLYWAAMNGHEGVARLLVEAGANKEAKDGDGRTPLYWAAENGHEGVARLLVEAGADKEAKDRDGRTPLYWAAMNGHEGVARLLVEAGADKEAKDGDGRTPLCWAAMNGHEGVARLLAEAGADKEAKVGDGRTPLHWAAMNGHKGVAKVLAEAGANKETRDGGYARTPLHWAAMNGHEGVAKVLAEAGADKEANDGDGRTPLHWAAMNGHEGVAKVLAEAGANKEAKDGGWRTPLCLAAENGHEGVAKVLAEAGADKEAKNGVYGRTPLYWAAMNGQEGIARVLAELGADKEANDGDGRTPLHWAAMNGQEGIARVLAELGADKEAKDGDGRTPLHWAAGSGHKGVARLLVELGADKEAKDGDGRTPLHWAAMNGQEGIARVLAELGADKEAKDGDGRTPLHRAAGSGHKGVARLLVELGADKEAKDGDGRTPLHRAAGSGHKGVARLLVELGARTPLHLAVRFGHKAVPRLFR
ncbi:hypothetical protein RB600_000848 [Gaeumannomyces tritici]